MKTKHAGALGLLAALVIMGLCWWLETSTRPAETVAPHTLGAVSVGGSKARTTTPPKDSELADGADRAGGRMTESAAAKEATRRPSVEDILAEPDDDFVRVAKKLSALALDVRLPMSEREEALAHVLNLSAGNEAEVLTPLIRNPDLPDSLAETILSEALNLPLGFQADLYLAALAARKSPELHKTIRGHLTVLTDGTDRGPRPEDWQVAIKAAKASWPD